MIINDYIMPVNTGLNKYQDLQKFIGDYIVYIVQCRICQSKLFLHRNSNVFSYVGEITIKQTHYRHLPTNAGIFVEYQSSTIRGVRPESFKVILFHLGPWIRYNIVTISLSKRVNGV